MAGSNHSREASEGRRCGAPEDTPGDSSRDLTGRQQLRDPLKLKCNLKTASFIDAFHLAFAASLYSTFRRVGELGQSPLQFSERHIIGKRET